MQVLNVEKLTKVYKNNNKLNQTHALKGMSLKINKGEFVGIMGPSGSGKTTFLNLLSGIDKATSGVINISGNEINNMNKNDLALFRRQHLGFVFQEFNLLDSLTLSENVMLPMILDRKDVTEIDNRTTDVMSLFEINEIKNKYPYEVSGGQQQRAAISRAIINNPDIVLADEPTGNLDSKSSRIVMECFQKLNQAQNCTILTVTHDAFAASYCKKIIFIKDGMINMEITKTGSRKDFFNKILECLAVLGGENDGF
ncbi:ABC transporter ATP-binding protein [Clostridium oryzae]|uniref:Bacitracin export ATP-binding protein BceA n=1 Tax=Clostridium oryzae TaxID=1450648 RepID=A0A1V4I4K9_9CLOT|nr:ABC transporter ATP-binding protein [Clostridium oryzae]OPJ54525.1 bacitracin export ATP-binding protein BceA [Clostridium oryzae]